MADRKYVKGNERYLLECVCVSVLTFAFDCKFSHQTRTSSRDLNREVPKYRTGLITPIHPSVTIALKMMMCWSPNPDAI
jgi:hypothetical protein